MDQEVEVHMNADRRVKGPLKGYDPFMNIVLDDALWVKAKGVEIKLGTIVIRGNAVRFWENLDKVK